MLGCHNCIHQGQFFPSYEQAPCASCAAMRNPAPLSRYPVDAASFNSLRVMHPAYVDESAHGVIDEALSALGQCVKALVSMKDSHPETYKFVIAKMDKPSLSYAEIAKMHNCKKQNVLYHFKKAVRIIPELSHALIVDRRFNGGKSRPPASRQPDAGSLGGG